MLDPIKNVFHDYTDEVRSNFEEFVSKVGTNLKPDNAKMVDFFSSSKNPLIALFAIYNGYASSVLSNDHLMLNKDVIIAMNRVFMEVDFNKLDKFQILTLVSAVFSVEDPDKIYQLIEKLNEAESTEIKDFQDFVDTVLLHKVAIKFNTQEVVWAYSNSAQEALKQKNKSKVNFLISLFSHDSVFLLSSKLDNATIERIVKFTEIHEKMIDEENDTGIPISILLNIAGILLEE